MCQWFRGFKLWLEQQRGSAPHAGCPTDLPAFFCRAFLARRVSILPSSGARAARFAAAAPRFEPGSGPAFWGAGLFWPTRRVCCPPLPPLQRSMTCTVWPVSCVCDPEDEMTATLVGGDVRCLLCAYACVSSSVVPAVARLVAWSPLLRSSPSTRTATFFTKSSGF